MYKSALLMSWLLWLQEFEIGIGCSVLPIHQYPYFELTSQMEGIQLLRIQSFHDFRGSHYYNTKRNRTKALIIQFHEPLQVPLV